MTQRHKVANPQLADAMRQLRRSSSTQPYSPNHEHKVGSRAAAKRKAIRKQLEDR